jgi:hypothetical protein
MKFCLRTLLFMVCMTALSFAGEHDFNGLVNAIENHYGVRHTHIPLLGFAMLFARPAGASGIKLAIFEDFPHSYVRAHDDVQHLVEGCLSRDWQLFVHARSHDDADSTLVYVNVSNGKLQMLIVNLGENDATIVELKLNEQALRKWINGPKESAEDQARHRYQADN